MDRSNSCWLAEQTPRGTVVHQTQRHLPTYGVISVAHHRMRREAHHRAKMRAKPSMLRVMRETTIMCHKGLCELA
jgi:hypothetical protein